jgi:hypothetical protein
VLRRLGFPLDRIVEVLDQPHWQLKDAVANYLPQEQTDFLAAIPRPARLAYRLIGERQYRNETTRLRGPLQP